MKTILWLAGSDASFKIRQISERMLGQVGVKGCRIKWAHPSKDVTGAIKYMGNGQKKVIEEKTDEVLSQIEKYIQLYKPDLIVCSDLTAIGHLTGNTSVDSCQGSVYYVPSGDRRIPMVCVAAAQSTFGNAKANWVFLNSLVKVRRWLEGTIRHQPKFTFEVCYTVEDVKRAKAFLEDCVLVAKDIETAATFITCIGYAGLTKSGRCHTYVIPFYNPRSQGNAHWNTYEEELEVWQLVEELHAHPVVKTMQNGSYDSTYFIKYGIPPKNWLLDSQHLFHATWCEADKALGKISPILLDWCQYWKEDIKGDADEKKAAEKDKARVPTSASGLMTYWRYNGLDCYYTLLDTCRLVEYQQEPQWEYARRNYVVEFLLQIGPYMFMSMEGLLLDQSRRRKKRESWKQEAETHIADLQIMVDDKEFNHKSPKQVASLIYDVLGGTPIIPRGRLSEKKRAAAKRATGEKILELIARQHPLFKVYIDKILTCKKPENLISKYGYMKTLASRFLYHISASGTKTNRSASKAHNLWVGTNAQNLPKHSRTIIVADKGTVLFDFDFSQSDSYFVAFESEDPKMMENVLRPEDTHLIHTEFFFQHKYEDLWADYKGANNFAGRLRNLTKPTVHGANYMMSGGTFYVQNGHDTVVSIAVALGEKKAHQWDKKQLENFSDRQLKRYKDLYPGLPIWIQNEINKAAENGNKATAYFGFTRLFFGDVQGDQRIQRELASHFGQGGTAGNMNRTMLKYHYQSNLRQQGLSLRLQVHDSLVGLVPENKIRLVKELQAIMQEPITIKGRAFSVPAEGELGYTWGAGLVDYDAELDNEQMLAKIRKQEDKVEATYREM